MTAALMVSCGGSKGPYGGYDDEGYTVSIKYDANGGYFTTNTGFALLSSRNLSPERDASTATLRGAL